MDWNQLRSDEACWNLSTGQKTLVAERVIARANAPRTFYFPILKPILAVAAMAVLIFGLLLLWPKKPIDEQIVTLPGSSSAAKPGEYVENKSDNETLPPKEETSGENQTAEKEDASDPQNTPGKEEKLPVAGEDQEEPSKESETPVIHRFWETEKEMPYEEAVAIVKEKLENRPHETLTDKERMAFYQCISTTAYAKYLYCQEHYVEDSSTPLNKKQPYADPENPNYRTDNPWFSLQISTTKDGVGLDFQTEIPLTFEEGYTVFDFFTPTIKETTESSYTKRIYTSYLNREDGTFLGKDSHTVIETELEYGTGYSGRCFNFENINILEEKLTKATIQEIVRYYLSFEPVTWVNIFFEDGFVDIIAD